MPYSSEVYLKASKVLEERRTRAKAEAARLRDELYSKVPELQSIDFEISKCYASPDLLSLGRVDTEKIDSLLREKDEIIEKCGYPRDCLVPRYTCAECQDTGRVNGVLCSCYGEICTEVALSELYGSSEAEKCTFASFDPSLYQDPQCASKMAKIAEFCRKYASSFSEKSDSLIMMGKTGLGKTHLSLAIAQEAVRHGYGVIYRPAQQMVSEMEDERFGRSGDKSSADFTKCDLLVIDDLGAEFPTQFTVAAIGNIINERLVAGLPTIISTNLGPGELTEKYTERTASRILGRYRLLGFVGNDMRCRK